MLFLTLLYRPKISYFQHWRLFIIFRVFRVKL